MKFSLSDGLGVKKGKPFKNCLFAVLLILGVLYLYLLFAGKSTFRITSASVKTLLRETPVKLITNTTVTMVTCTVEDIVENSDGFSKNNFKDMLLGSNEGVLIAKVIYDYGIDLEELSESDIEIGENFITITLPEPKQLRNSIDIGSIRDFTKSAVLRSIWDKALTGRDIKAELRSSFQKNVVAFAKENDLEPTKQEIIRNIEPFFNALISNKTDKRIVFK